MLTKTSDGSIEDRSGKVLYFSFERFMSDIVAGDCCFICGVSPRVSAFNNEHALPDWILRRYGLHGRTIRLPNGASFKYGGLTVPCCIECNEVMGETFEKPLSDIFSRGFSAVVGELNAGPWRLFCWLALIFLKTHLKDKSLNFHLDRRKGKTKIGEIHSWSDLYHIHCVARAFFTGCALTEEVLGSLVLLPAKVLPHFESFDFGDFSFASTILLRMDDTAIIVVLDDSEAALSIYDEELNKIPGPLSPLQAREIALRLASIKLQLAEGPRFSSEIDRLTEKISVVAHRPNEWRVDWKDEILGTMMHRNCEGMLANMPQREAIIEQMRTGRYTFLLDTHGNFIREQLR